MTSRAKTVPALAFAAMLLLHASCSTTTAQLAEYNSVGKGGCRDEAGKRPRYYAKFNASSTISGCRDLCTTLSAACAGYTFDVSGTHAGYCEFHVSGTHAGYCGFYGSTLPDFGGDLATLFGTETDEALTALVAEIKESYQGFSEVTKADIDMLEWYRNEEHDTSLIAEEGQDILLDEIFIAMVAQSPVEMVVQTIKALKASEETPKIEELENIKAMMIDGLYKKAINPANVFTDEEIEDTTTESSATSSTTTSSSSSTITSTAEPTTEPTTPVEPNTTIEPTTTAQPATESESATETIAVVEAFKSANFEQTNEDSAERTDNRAGFRSHGCSHRAVRSCWPLNPTPNQRHDFEQMKIPLIIAGSVAGIMLVAIGAVVGIRRRRSNAHTTFVNAIYDNGNVRQLEASVVGQASMV